MIWKKPAFQAAIILAMLTFAVSIATLPFPSFNVLGSGNAPAYAPDRSLSATAIPLAQNASGRVVISLVTSEVVGQLADGVTYTYWTFNGTVPGPLIRLREGQTVEMHIKNLLNSTMSHSIDSHAILGPGGGSAVSQTPPGKESIFQFKTMRVGLYVYHCATPDIPTHIANGMYGLMLVEPQAGLPKVDREFYVVQGEFYTRGRLGELGYQPYDIQKAQAETPEYVVFNGRVGALTGTRVMKAKVGETVRIFFGNGGPNLISSFHVIGGILDRVYPEGAIVSEPNRNVQTTLVPAGGATMVEFQTVVPANLLLVDHSLFRINRGAIAILSVEGPANPDIYSSIQNATTGQGDSHVHTTASQTSSVNLAAPASGTLQVLIQNYAYLPAEIVVTAGTTVTWINRDDAVHTATEGVPESPKAPNQRFFDSPLLQRGESWSFTFTKPGIYYYYCVPHPYMRARITVVGAPTGTGSPPTIGLSDTQMFSAAAFGVGLAGLLVGMMVGVRVGKPSENPRKETASGS